MLLPVRTCQGVEQFYRICVLLKSMWFVILALSPEPTVLKALFCKDIKTDLLSQDNTLFEMLLYKKRKEEKQRNLISVHSKEKWGPVCLIVIEQKSTWLTFYLQITVTSSVTRSISFESYSICMLLLPILSNWAWLTC